jgi:hypothetical protein
MSISNKFRKLVLSAPKFVRSPVLRQMIHFPQEIPQDLRFKVAETKEELEQAFALLHDAYVKESLMTPHPSGMRVTKYHALPSTTTLIALQGSLVVGTVSLVRQSAFGIPLESIFTLNKVPPGSRVAEVSSLAIRNGFQQQRGRILFPLLKFMFHYSTDYFGVTHFVIAVNPKWYDFYESVLLFQPLSRKMVDSYDFVNGAPAVGGMLDLKASARNYMQLYGNKSLKHNLAHFFLDVECTNMEFPLRKKSVISDPVLSVDLMRHFFIEQTGTFDKLNDFEKLILRELYNTPEYMKLIPAPNVIQLKARKEKRFETRLHGRIPMPEDRSVRIEVQNVCENGLGGLTNGPVPVGPCQFQIDIEDYEPCIMQGQVLWRTQQGHFGCIIADPPAKWRQFIQNMNTRLTVHLEEKSQPTPPVALAPTRKSGA